MAPAGAAYLPQIIRAKESDTFLQHAWLELSLAHILRTAKCADGLGLLGVGRYSRSRSTLLIFRAKMLACFTMILSRFCSYCGP